MVFQAIFQAVFSQLNWHPGSLSEVRAKLRESAVWPVGAAATFGQVGAQITRRHLH